MTREEILSNVDPEWHKAFWVYVQTAEAEPGFIEYMTSHPEVERAVEQAVRLEAESLGELTTLLSRSLAKSPEVLSTTMAQALRDTMLLAATDRDLVIRQAMQRLSSEGGESALVAMQKVLSSMIRTRVGS